MVIDLGKHATIVIMVIHHYPSESLHKDGVQDVFVFCNHSELKM